MIEYTVYYIKSRSY